MDKSWLFTFIPPSQLVAIAFAVVCAFGSWTLYTLRKRLRGQEYDAVFDRLDKLATIVVLELDQTLVLPAKAGSQDGKLSPETVAVIKARAVERMKLLLGDSKSELRRAFGDFAGAFETLIEAKVREVRMGRKLK